MTRHRSTEDRRREILDAAMDLIDQAGVSGLTMEGVVSRCSLSKGGVYRYFSNKSELIAALLHHILDGMVSVDIEEALSWRQPLLQTLMRVIMEKGFTDEGHRLHRVWVKLLPETLHDAALIGVLNHWDHAIGDLYGRLITSLLDRDHISAETDFPRKLSESISLGLLVMHGVTLKSLWGTPETDLKSRMQRFIEVMINETLQQTRTAPTP